MKNLKFKISVLLLFFALDVEAQTVKAVLDSNLVELGNPVRLTVSAVVTSGQKTYFPNFKDGKVSEFLELLTEFKPDTTVSQDRKQVTFTHVYLITSYKDSSLYVPSLPIRVGNDTLYTDSLKIEFTLLQNIDSTFTAEIDTTKTLKIFDLKPVKETPWTFEEFWARFSTLILALLVVALIASIATYMYIRWKNNKPIIPILKPKEPADKVALRNLAALKEKKLWQQGKSKEYYTVLTDILKRYISDRWEKSVMESTSDETLKILSGFVESRSENYQAVKYILGVADFVKFAKLEPMPEENENSMDYAFKFVEATRPVAETNAETELKTNKNV